MARLEVTGRRMRRQDYDDEADAFSVAEFCRRHKISVQLYYKLRAQNLTPAGQRDH
jgi:hypothetical protein